MSQVYVSARDRYKPCGKIRFLLIAECLTLASLLTVSIDTVELREVVLVD